LRSQAHSTRVSHIDDNGATALFAAATKGGRNSSDIDATSVEDERAFIFQSLFMKSMMGGT